VIVEHRHRLRDGVHEGPQPVLGLPVGGQRRGQLRAVQLGLGPPGEVGEHADLLGGEGPRLGVEDAEGADPVPAGGVQRDAGVGPEERLARHQLVGREPGVVGGVGDRQRRVGLDGAGAERGLPVRLVDGHALVGLEPEPVGVHQGDEGDRGAHEPPGGPGDPVETLLRWGVQKPERPQSLKPPFLVCHRQQGCHSWRAVRDAVPVIARPPVSVMAASGV
jgi:hypothetical protein